ncbi:MAG: hypothetical protein GY951_00875 [Psychromonas sp.]|nr:hypothetical protein [Alteromonadales bacterium]MCP5076602.1 hypothetical protein [Psychromonas sp.]
MTTLLRRYLDPKLAVIIATFVIIPSVNAIPIVDGFASENEYSNYMAVKWYNDHEPDGSQFPKAGDQKTAVYYDWSSATNNFYLYLEAPLAAKNMIWGSGWTKEEALLYYQQWCSPSDGVADETHDGGSCGHHKDGFDTFVNKKGSFHDMTYSEKVIFAGIEVSLAGNIPEKDESKKKGKKKGKKKDEPKSNKFEYKDSVDYVINKLNCDINDCEENDTPMAFEFLFNGYSEGDYLAMLDLIEKNGVIFHLSPERGGPGSDSNVPTPTPIPTPPPETVPEPSMLWLFSLVLLLLGYSGKKGLKARNYRKQTF